MRKLKGVPYRRKLKGVPYTSEEAQRRALLMEVTQ